MTTPITSFSGRYSFLSNFSPAPVYILIGTKWVRCPTVEHGFQASKTLSQHWRRKIVDAPTARDAKAFGHKVQRVSYWEDVKIVVMLELLRQKFSRSKLRDQLVRTELATLIEGNTWHDNFWGICSCGTCSDARRRDDIDGQNWLGKLLMRVRKDIQ